MPTDRDGPCETCGKYHDFRDDLVVKPAVHLLVAAERARIRAAVMRLEAKESGEIKTGTCYVHQQWGCATCRPMQWEPDGDATLSRAAVLAIIDQEDA